MLSPRLLVVLVELPDLATLLDTALAALTHARHPYGLRFAVPSRHAAELSALSLPPGALAQEDFKAYDDAAGFAALGSLMTDETHFLILQGMHDFAPNWDTVLLSRYRRIRAKGVLLTATLSGEPGGAQAYLPAIRAISPEGCGTVDRGTALVCSAAPVRTLVADPRCLFGDRSLLQTMTWAEGTLSIAAFAAGRPIFALDRAPFWPLEATSGCVRLTPPGPEHMPPTVLSRFEQHAGLSFTRRTVSVRAQAGVFTVEDGYAQRLPVRLRLQNGLRNILPSAVPPAPLVVTAFIDQPAAHRPPHRYMLHFSYLMALAHLPLMLYAGGVMERHMRSRFPHTLAYPDNSLLPRALLADGITPMQLMQRSKLLLLQRACRTSPASTHIAWMDIDMLPHPVCPEAWPDFSALMDDRVHLAWVDGEPDASLLVLPVSLITLLVREVRATTQFDAALKRDFSEQALMRHLVEHFPDLFTLHPMPRRQMLFLSCLPPALLSVPLAHWLRAAARPIRVPPATPPAKEMEPK